MSKAKDIQPKEKAARINRKPDRESVLQPTFAVSRRSPSRGEWDAQQPSDGSLLQRQCACSTHTIAGSECDHCRRKRESSFLQRATVNPMSDKAEPPTLVEEQSLPKTDFGSDFSQVPTHTVGLQSEPIFQANFNVNAPGGKYEQEADQINHPPPIWIDSTETRPQFQSRPDSTFQRSSYLNIARTGPQVVQRANADDQRLPADQGEALQYAGEADAAIQAVLASLQNDGDPTRVNTFNFVQQYHLNLQPLMPRHDSGINGQLIHYFTDQQNYDQSFWGNSALTHVVHDNNIFIRARQHDNIDNLLTNNTIKARLVQAVSEAAHVRAAAPGAAPDYFEIYRAKFNSYWDAAPFAGQTTDFDPTLDSNGPRTQRARAIFNHIFEVDNPAMKWSYEANQDNIRERIDTYLGPEGLNRVNSPRLQALREAFNAFPKPVPNYINFRAAVQPAAHALTNEDREAVRQSNDWQRLINAHVTQEGQRNEIKGIIDAIPAAVAQPGLLEGFRNNWFLACEYDNGGSRAWWQAGANVQYRHGGQTFKIAAVRPDNVLHPGTALSIKAEILRGGIVIAGPYEFPFPPNPTYATTSDIPVLAPAGLAGPDNLTFRAMLFNDQGHLISFMKMLNIAVQPEVPFTEEQARGVALEDAFYLNGSDNNGLLGKMRAQGGIKAQVANAISPIEDPFGGDIQLVPLTIRHDSAAYVTIQRGAPDPGYNGYFLGYDYSESMVAVVGAAGFQIPGTNKIAVNRTPDINNPGNKRSDDDIITLVVHESVHAMDIRPDSNTDLERYKTEFRAYWTDGRYNGLSTAYDPNMPAPGPKSPRARAIFDHLYYSATYTFVKPAYDNNVNGFREAVDNYLIPDGINLIVSSRLEALRGLINNWDGNGFNAFHSQVQAYMGIGAAPALGALNGDERNEIIRNRAWRDLVERKVMHHNQRDQIKNTLGIPG